MIIQLVLRDKSFVKEYVETKAKLETMYHCITEGMITQSRYGLYELGKNFSHHFLNLEKITPKHFWEN